MSPWLGIFRFLVGRLSTAGWTQEPAANVTAVNFSYQLDLETPGISPLSARPRKHKRHRANLRRYPRGRPHSLQRLCGRVENFCFFRSLTRFAVVAMISFFSFQLLFLNS